MNDDRLTTALGSFYKGTTPTPPDPELGLERVMTRVRKTRQRGRWWPLPAFDRPVSTFPSRELAPALIPATNGRTRPRGSTMFSALKFITAGVIVALFGGFLLAGVLTTPNDDLMAPAAVTESPSPMTAEELLSGMVTEEVEPGVFRVDHDGVRDLSSADYWGVFAGQDGSIWLDFSRLGVAETHDWQLAEHDSLEDLEVTPGGTVWAVAVKDDESTLRDEWTDRDESTLRSFDGETWTTHRAVDMRYGVGDVEVASDGVVWAALGDGTLGYLDADDSTWQTIETPTTRPSSEAAGSLPGAGEPYEEGEFVLAIRVHGFIATESDVWAPDYGGVWHYADGAWEHITYGGADTGALPDDVFWGLGPGTGRPVRSEEDWGQGVSRFDGRTWVRYLPGMYVPYLGMDIAPDGSVWVHAWEGEDREDPYAGPGHLYVITPEAVAATK